MGRVGPDCGKGDKERYNGEKAWKGSLGSHHASLYFLENSRRSLSRGMT